MPRTCLEPAADRPDQQADQGDDCDGGAGGHELCPAPAPPALSQARTGRRVSPVGSGQQQVYPPGEEHGQGGVDEEQVPVEQPFAVDDGKEEEQPREGCRTADRSEHPEAEYRVPDPPVPRLGPGAPASQAQRTGGDEGEDAGVARDLLDVVIPRVVGETGVVGAEHERSGHQGHEPPRQRATGEESVADPCALGARLEGQPGDPLGGPECQADDRAGEDPDRRAEPLAAVGAPECSEGDHPPDPVDGQQDASVDDRLDSAGQKGEPEPPAQQEDPAALLALRARLAAGRLNSWTASSIQGNQEAAWMRSTWTICPAM